MDKTIYFKGLNGIRAIAALLVVIWHSDQFTELFNLKPFGFHSNQMAGNAVDLFFVLSGFLITYLLLVEKEKIKRINLKNFYLRRIFRIWPLYYLSVFISLTLYYFNIIPEVADISSSVFFYLFLMANVAYVLDLAISSITPLWSVGVEEQFYLIWPHIINRTTKFLKVFIFFILSFLVVKLMFYLVFSAESTSYHFFSLTRIDIMGIGAIGGYLVYAKHKFLKFLYRKDLQIASWVVLIVSIFYKPIHIFSFIDQEINALFYLVLILNVSNNKHNLISLENKAMNFIGKISYGIYIYHMIIIYLLAFISKKYLFQFNHITMYSLVISTTIGVAWLSYTYFESPILKIKNKYAVVKSTNSDTNS